MRKVMTLVVLLTMLTQVQAEQATHQPVTARDIHSFAKPELVSVTHLDLDLRVDFERRVIQGLVGLELARHDPQAALILDSRDLTIKHVFLADKSTPTPFSLGQPQPHLGSSLTIQLPPDCNTVYVEYETSPDAKALQWLQPSQTAGKQQPFLFSQSQAVLARTWIPCQDSPAVRTTYNAQVKVPPAALAVMSAANPQAKRADGVYQFEMKQPIPAYLLALAVGDIEFRAMGERSGIYAEPSVVEAAAWEFAQTERMIAAAEELYGPYRWDRYDILVLPPSFPFGGMENPRLTFATPTVLAGDRSLVALIAHELAHSWSGNLVTNATWNDFWLNEGFTVYFEHRIMEAVNGRGFDEMWAQLGKDGLRREMEELKPRDTWLHLDLAGRDPDDGLTDVAYEKGYLFLRMLEEAVGRDKWDPFLRSYFDKFAFQSMTTDRFLRYLDAELVSKESQEVQDSLRIEEWVYGPGLPSNEPTIVAEELDQIATESERFATGTTAAELQVDNWTTHHWLQFLRSLKRPLPTKQMEDLDRQFKFSDSGNSEILHDWLLHGIAAEYEPAMQPLYDFLTKQGRRKFLMPLYEELWKSEAGRKRAADIYRAARPTYHPLAVDSVDRLLKWDASPPAH